MRIAIIDESGLRATILEEGLREAGFDDIEVVNPTRGFVARLERMASDVVLMNLGNPSRDSLEEMLAVSRALARPIVMFVDQSDESMIAAAIDAIGVGPDAPNRNELDRAILRSIDEQIDQHRIGDETWETWATLSKYYDKRQLMDLVFTIGHYAMTGWAMSNLDVPIEEGADAIGFDLRPNPAASRARPTSPARPRTSAPSY